MSFTIFYLILQKMIFLLLRRFTRTVLLCFLLISIVIYYHISTTDLTTREVTRKDLEKIVGSDDLTKRPTENVYDIIVHPGRIVITYIISDTAQLTVRETLNSIKSVIIFTQMPIHIILIVSIESHRTIFKTVLNRWRMVTRHIFEYEIRTIIVKKTDNIIYDDQTQEHLAQKVFFPDLFPKIDAMIYLNTDTILLGPVQELWGHFRLFNTSQIAGVAEQASLTPHPKDTERSYGKYGLSDGVILMNLTRMRQFGWTKVMNRLVDKWKRFMRYEHEILNVIFRYHRRSISIISCRYNFHSSMCASGNLCKDAATRGVFLLQGTRISDQAAFTAISRAIYELRFRMRPMNLVDTMNKYLEAVESSSCGKYKDYFLKVPTQTLRDLYYL